MPADDVRSTARPHHPTSEPERARGDERAGGASVRLAEPEREAGGGQSTAGRSAGAEASLPGLGLTRRRLAAMTGAVVAIWILFIFTRAVSDAASVTSQEMQLHAQNARLEAQIAARQRELLTIQSPAFVALEARAYGYGAPNEQVFALRPGAPPPPRMTPLGTDPTAQMQRPPIDAWLELLFGH